MDKPFQIALVVGVFAIAFVLYRDSENRRYLYSANGSGGVVLDTRSGEFWTEDGTHFEPRFARITAHHPSVDDQTANDDSTNRFRDCLHEAVTHGKSAKDCVTQKYASPSGTQSSTSDVSK